MSTLPSLEEMHAARAARDGAYEGLFVFAVRTTGVFCRPSCPSRRAAADNVSFFASAEEAERAGFRPCRRCRPEQLPDTHPQWMTRLLAEVERRDGARVRDSDLRALGLEPATVRRAFLRLHGVSFQAWQRARALVRAQSALAAGAAPGEVADRAGYASESGFRSAFAGLFSASPSAARHLEPLRAGVLPSPLGPLGAVASSRGICMLEFEGRKALDAQVRDLERRHGRPAVPGESPHLAQLERELAEYFAGRRARFEVPLDLAGPPFHLAVWRLLLEIPAGATRSYGELARALGNPGASRAVAQANARNKIAILVPCHRVVAADGSLAGYAAGLARKRFLLDLEQTFGR